VKRAWSLLWAARWIARWEGFLSKAYLDTLAEPNVWTIGYGHTGGVLPWAVISKPAALRLLAKDCRFAAKTVSRSIGVPLTVRQRMALISLVFNCGPAAVEGSTLQRLLNKSMYRSAGLEILKWDHAGGVRVLGLTRRRRAEYKMFMSKLPRSSKHGTRRS